MSTVYISLEEAVLLCNKLGGLKVRDLGLLDSALHRPRSGFAGMEAYPTLALKAAALLHSVVKNHSLFDGNKRLGWMVCGVFMLCNGYRSNLSHAEAVTLVLDVAGGNMDVEDIATRLRVVEDA